MLRKNNIKKHGFTLVEMLVATAIFTVVMITAVGSLVSIINQNRKSQEVKTVIDNITFAMNNIASGLKDAKIANSTFLSSYRCLYKLDNDTSTSKSCPNGGLGIQYLNQYDKYIQYRFVKDPLVGEGNIQKRTCTGDDDGCDQTWLSMTAPQNILNITNMVFYVFNADSASTQSRALIVAEGYVSLKDGSKSDFKIQTTSNFWPRIK